MVLVKNNFGSFLVLTCNIKYTICINLYVRFTLIQYWHWLLVHPMCFLYHFTVTTTLFLFTCTGSISSHSPFISRSPYSPIHQHATWTKDCYENKLSITHKHLQRSCMNQNTWKKMILFTYASYIFNLCEWPLISKKTHPYLWNIFYKRSIELVNSVTVELRRSRDELD